MKVKHIISRHIPFEDRIALDEQINEFIKDKVIIDIKYSSSISVTGHTSRTVDYSALILYKEPIKVDQRQNVISGEKGMVFLIRCDTCGELETVSLKDGDRKLCHSCELSKN
ncbi:sporulation protein Cse60 [Streptococcus suis]|uniref:sporulation protein Cse60 n=1 Tax=Streptococcus suis TaxID=1307 RepID=UPI0038BCA42E